MLENFTDWFWEFMGFDPSELEGLGSAGQALLELVPIILGIVLVLGLFMFVAFRGREEEEEEETEGLSELDLEIAKIRELQRKKR